MELPPQSLSGRAGSAEFVEVEADVERIVFHNEDSGWTVTRIRVGDPPRQATAVGRLLGIRSGESLQLRGRWVQDPKYGRQFRVDSFSVKEPTSLEGIERYLASGILPGVGKVTAHRLVEEFGVEVLDILDNQPEKLRSIPGIGRVRLSRIVAAWKQQRAERDSLIFLQGHGISARFAVRILKHFGGDTIGVVRNNPYRLAEEIHGFGFTAADRVAVSLGWEPAAPERMAGGALFALRQAAGEGHVFMPHDRLVTKAAELLAAPESAVGAVLPALASRGAVVIVGADAEDSDHSDAAVYLPELHDAETGSTHHLRRVAAGSSPLPAISIERALTWFESRHTLSLAPVQRQAVAQGLKERVLIITGGPGTGKTTLIRAIVEILHRKKQRILQAAPTGRAANRLSEATHTEVKTVHRLLEFDPHGGVFRRHRSRPLEADLVIVDEVSMLDTQLAHALFQAISNDTRLILVGDADQLPSVGPGRVLQDMIASRAFPVVRLQEIFRQKDTSRIILNAHRIHRGLKPEVDSRDANGDFFFIARETPESVLETVLEVVTERVPKGFGIDPRLGIQVLAPMRRGILGTENLNLRLQSLLNPAGRPLASSDSIRIGDRVMQIRNNYDLDVFNGDVGSIERLDHAEKRVLIRFDSRVVAYDIAQLDELTLAYACTVHKSQGSEYRCVVMPLHAQHYVMLQRNLLYTAVTRARDLLILVGEERALDIAVRNQSEQKRFTGLEARLRAGASTGSGTPAGAPPTN